MDKKTGLEWKRCSEGQTWTGEMCTGEAAKYNWNDASRLRNNFAGKTDWRLPAIAELSTLVVCRNGKQREFIQSSFKGYVAKAGCHDISPTINLTVFPNTPQVTFWSSTLLADNSVHSWFVDFDVGSEAWSYQYESRAVRLVRSVK